MAAGVGATRWCPSGTCSLRVANAGQEDVEEPLQRVLVHGVDVGQVRHAEEKDLCAHGHGDVLQTGGVDVLLCLLGHGHLGLQRQQRARATSVC